MDRKSNPGSDRPPRQIVAPGNSKGRLVLASRDDGSVRRIVGIVSCWCCLWFGPAGLARGQVAVVRQAPVLNGKVQGSIRQMTAENTTLNGGASVTGDLLVPGAPTVRLNGSPAYGGTVEGSGAATPANYTVTLNGGASLRHVVRRTNAAALPTVSAPPPPAGTRSVTLNHSAQSPGNFATLRNLTLNGKVGPVAVPPGTYGNFTANAGSGFTLGLAGGTTPAAYDFQNLTLNSNSVFTVVGPVVVTVNGGFSTNGNMGTSAHPEWLHLRIAGGGCSLNGNAAVYANLEAPNGTLTLNGNTTWVGAVAVDRLMVNGNSLLRLIAPAVSNQPPTITLTAPADGSSFTAPGGFMLVASAADADGTVARVEFYQGPTKIGEDAVAPYQFTTTGLAAGSYTFSARALDDQGAATTSPSARVTVNRPNQAPAVTLSAPADGASYDAPAGFLLSATATDPDGTVAQVEFFQNGTRLGQDTSAPFEFAVGNLAAGTYHFFARATDNLGLTADTASVSVTVSRPNVAPAVALDAPVEGATFTAPATITLAATATDSDGTVAQVEFFNGNAKLGEAASAPFEFVWTSVPAGTYVVTAKATDNVGATTTSAPVTITVTANGVPFLANFEPAEGYQAGPLDGQQGWTVDGLANVVSSPVYFGQQAVVVAPSAPPALLVRAFVNSDPSVTFVDLFAQPAAGPTPDDGVFFETNSTRVALTGVSSKGILQAFDGDGTGGGAWFPTGKGPALDATGRVTEWQRLTVRSDYGSKTWDLYLNGQMIASDLGFLSNTTTAFTGLGLSGHSTLTTNFDDLLVAFDNPLFVDADRDGMDDAWETAHGLNPEINDRVGDADHDGLTNIQEFILGTDPKNTDTDGDGLWDAGEITFGYNPLVPEAAAALGSDGDGDGLTLAQELMLGTDPNTADHLGNLDTDGDGLPDVWEVIHGTNPRQPEALEAINSDADGDGLTLVEEAQAGTNPNHADTDGDGLPDGYEVRNGLDSLADDGALDPDGDGLNNREEFRRGTDPNDYYNGVAHEILPFIGGDFDLGARGLLAVRVTDRAGNAMVNAPVVLELEEGSSQISLTPDGPLVGRTIEIRTGPGGIARAYVRTP